MTTAPQGRLRKELRLLDVYAISTGAMFSSGFFLLPGLAAAQTGPSVTLAYLVAALFIMPAMFAVAELATAMPRAGGAYYFLDRSLGPLVGTVGGLGTWIALVFKSAFALVGMGAYLAIYMDVPMRPLAAALAVAFALVNVVGAKETSGLQRVLVAALVGIMAVFVVDGLLAVGERGFVETTSERFTPFFAFGASGFLATVGFVFVSYAGLTKVASVSEEVRNPDRNIPLGMMLSLATAAVVYSLGVYVMVALLPPERLRSDLTPVASAAEALFTWLPDGVGVALVVVAAIAAFASTGNAGVLSASRYPLAMARDRLVPRELGRLGRFHTPTRSIVVTATLMVATIMLFDVESIAKLASAFQLLLFSLLSLAVVIMRESGIEGYDPGYRSPLYPWMQIVGFLAPFWLIAEMGQLAIAFTLGLIAVTSAWYFRYARTRVQRSGAIFHAFARLGRLRHGGLDSELREIVREKGLREEDAFEEVVARASVLEVPGTTSFEHVARLASKMLAIDAGVPRDDLERGFLDAMAAGFVPVARGCALPHLRVEGTTQATMLLVRCHATSGAIPSEPGADTDPLRAVVFLVGPRRDPGRHLRLLGHLATQLGDPEFLVRWTEARGEDGLRGTLLREERSVRLEVGRHRATARWEGVPLRSIRLPKDVLVALVRRGPAEIVPNGSTVLQPGDHVTLIGTPEGIRRLGRHVSGEPASAVPAGVTD